MLPAEPRKHASQNSADSAPERTPLPAGFSGEMDLAPAPPSALSAAPTLGTLMHALRKSWRLAVPVSLGGAVVAAALTWLLVPAQYTTYSAFRIQARPPGGGSLEDESNFAGIQKSQVAILKSYDVLSEGIAKSRIAELYGLQTSPEQIQKSMLTNFDEGPEQLRVILSGPDPEAVAALLNAIGEVYPGKTNLLEETSIKHKIAQLERRLAVDPGRADAGRVPTIGEQLRDKRAELNLAEKKAGLDDANDLRAAVGQDRTELTLVRQKGSAHKSLFEGRTRELESKRDRLAKMRPPTIGNAEAMDSLRADPEYMELSKDITALRKNIADHKINLDGPALARILAEQRPKLRGLERSRKEMIEDAKEKLAAQKQKVDSDNLRKDIDELADKLQVMKGEDSANDAEIKRLQRKVDEQEFGLKAPPHVLGLRDEVEQLLKEYQNIGAQVSALKGSLPLQPRVVRQAEAFVPTEKDYRRPVKFSLASAGFVFACLLGGICLLEARGRRVYTSSELRNNLGMPIIGALPKLPPAARARSAAMLANGDPHYGMTEAVDAIRTVLLHAPRVEGVRVIMIASAREGEGKTTLASHLAASLARAWRKTLLIDGDLRNPNQHEQFGQPLEPGFCEALRGEVEFEDAIKQTPISRLWLLSAGKIDAHALQALAQEGVHAIFDWLEDQYDFIIVDSSPILPVPDALMLGKQADAVLLSVMKDVSRLPEVYQAQQRLEALQIRILGTVIIGEKIERYGHAVPYGHPPTA